MSQKAFPMSEPNPQEGNSQQGLGSRIRAHFAELGGVELDLPERIRPCSS